MQKKLELNAVDLSRPSDRTALICDPLGYYRQTVITALSLMLRYIRVLRSGVLGIHR